MGLWPMLPIGHIRRFIGLCATVFTRLAGAAVGMSWMRRVSLGVGDPRDFRSDGFRFAQPILRLLKIPVSELYTALHSEVGASANRKISSLE
jgi:hypothetical protein